MPIACSSCGVLTSSQEGLQDRRQRRRCDARAARADVLRSRNAERVHGPTHLRRVQKGFSPDLGGASVNTRAWCSQVSNVTPSRTRSLTHLHRPKRECLATLLGAFAARILTASPIVSPLRSQSHLSPWHRPLAFSDSPSLGRALAFSRTHPRSNSCSFARNRARSNSCSFAQNRARRSLGLTGSDSPSRDLFSFLLSCMLSTCSRCILTPRHVVSPLYS